ncbi:MAG: Asp23/Gls24 family envelope stress response protein [Anaerovoracaceae bacterium]
MTNIQEDNLGTVRISDDVIIICATNATLKVKGVSELSGGITDNLSKNILGKDPITKGVKLSRSEDEIILDIYVIVEYEVKIPQLAWEIQNTVKKEIEDITELKVQSINIHVQGVNFPKEDK